MQQPLRELIRFRAPQGFQAAVASTAEREGLSLSAYLRRLALLDLARRNEAERSKAQLAMHAYQAGC